LWKEKFVENEIKFKESKRIDVPKLRKGIEKEYK